MNTPVYNVLWADDQVEYEIEQVKEELSQFHITVIDVAHSGIELEAIMEKNRGFFDAVIVDANFHIENNSVQEEREISGFRQVLHLIDLEERLGYKTQFFLWTGRDFSIISSQLTEREYGYFKPGQNVFNKLEGRSHRRALMRAIRQSVSDANTIEWQLRSRYKKEISAARFVDPKAEKDLLKFLIKDTNQDLTDTEHYYAWVRTIFEAVKKHGELHKIFPPLSKLNALGTLLEEGALAPDCRSNNYMKGWKLINPNAFVHPALGHSFKYLLDYAQEGSHYMTDRNVREYVKYSGDIHLFRALLYITMDFLKWYYDLFKKVEDSNNTNYTLDNLWKEIEFKSLTVTEKIMNNKAHYYVKGENYIIELFRPSQHSSNQDLDVPTLQEGSVVTLKKWIKNTPMTDFICRNGDYEIE